MVQLRQTIPLSACNPDNSDLWVDLIDLIYGFKVDLIDLIYGFKPINQINQINPDVHWATPNYRCGQLTFKY